MTIVTLTTAALPQKDPTVSIPVSVPVALRPLFDKQFPGEQIAYDLSDPLYQAIRTYHPNLKSVGRYTKLLLAYDTETKDGSFSPPAITQAKAQMVTEVLAFYNQTRKDSKEDLKARVAELEEKNRRVGLALEAALKRAALAEAALAKVTA